MTRASSALKSPELNQAWVNDMWHSRTFGLTVWEAPLNTEYECQARRLAALAEQASGVEAPWWIDSLCVPGSELHRQKSICQLRNVYTNATKVVAIDKAISQCRSDSTAENVLWAVVSSSWMQRLWAYQESFLATSIVV